jgi:2-C-methyl-D-erythritol 4-phosphate cytidylyltransferase / 2-C-methyl-D-erythritol 2,4-cyclodiphosphate synthase
VTSTAVLIVAAGRGSRARGAGGVPKQYAQLGVQTVLTHTLLRFLALPGSPQVICVIHPDDQQLYDAATFELHHHVQLLAPVYGGATRQSSVRAGLDALIKHAPTHVLIHDAARPFVTTEAIAGVLAALTTHGGAIAGEPLADTLKRAGPDQTIVATVDRAHLWRAQTPQGFHFNAILQAHHAALTAGELDFTDDAAVAEWAGLPVQLVPSGASNFKITTADDLLRAAHMMTPAPTLAPVPMMARTGLGFDIHSFADGDHVWLGGVQIPHTHKLDGHSDADVVLHALTDALLGTIGDGDIGQHFPPSDPQLKGAASIMFLQDAVRRVRARGGVIINVDITVLAEAPKIGPHRPAMQALLAAALGVTVRDVGVKATTMETLGAVGRREGIAAMAVATVALPAPLAAT